MDGMEFLIMIGGAIVVLIVGLGAGYLLQRKMTAERFRLAEQKAREAVEEAKREAEGVRKEAEIQAKDHFFRARAEFEQEAKERRQELLNMEKRLLQKEENLEKRVDLLDQKEGGLTKREKTIQQQERTVGEKEKRYNLLIEEQRHLLEQIAGITADEAKERFMKLVESEMRHESAKMIKRIEEETQSQADKKAKEIIVAAIQRYAADYVAEETVSVVNLPNEEMKGRIIGREGRNIRALEAATGVDLIIDDTPEAVIISGFNPIRREVARITLERLITDGRIHPGRIEEIVAKAEQEIEQKIREAGERATFDVGVHGIHPELIRMVGRLKYRTSFAQNVFQHSLEVAFLAGAMAAELGLNIKQAKRAGLLHDIGKAVDHEVEGSHALIGADLARKYAEAPKVVHSIAAHHDDEKPQSALDVLIQAADALSAARPGARREMLETYVKRLEELERIAFTFPGISKAYAIQAGREIRVIVENEEISDADATMLSRDIARKIENELSYPGQIKVTVIREMRAVDYAK
ncbi:MAG: metal dependent phosphohydrolase [Deltaproteobacteria bacterium]|nr:metal dependent phosphohydrolase [Deltaproteobacteria bacterium]